MEDKIAPSTGPAEEDRQFWALGAGRWALGRQVRLSGHRLSVTRGYPHMVALRRIIEP
jgi:hypothetical protein